MLGVRTVLLGLSNVSHGMPVRPLLNRTFLAMAIASGSTRPSSTRSIPRSWRRSGRRNCSPEGIRAPDATLRTLPFCRISKRRPVRRRVRDSPDNRRRRSPATRFLLQSPSDAIIRGDHEASVNAGERSSRRRASARRDGQRGRHPRARYGGQALRRGRYFLPQLIASAHAAQRVCDTVSRGSTHPARRRVPDGFFSPRSRAIFTISGRMSSARSSKATATPSPISESDVPTAEILEAAERERPDIVGLSALMTSTMEEMEQAAR